MRDVAAELQALRLYLPFSQTGGALLFHLLSKLYEPTGAAGLKRYAASSASEMEI